MPSSVEHLFSPWNVFQIILFFRYVLWKLNVLLKWCFENGFDRRILFSFCEAWNLSQNWEGKWGEGGFLETYLKIILHFSNISNHEQIMFLKSFRQCIAMCIVHKIIKEMVYHIETSGKWGRGLSRKHIWKLFLPHFQSPTNHVSQKLPTIWRNYKKRNRLFLLLCRGLWKMRGGGLSWKHIWEKFSIFQIFSITNKLCFPKAPDNAHCAQNHTKGLLWSSTSSWSVHKISFLLL